MKKLGFVVLTVASAFVLSLASGAVGDSMKPTIVLVHGAFVDGSSWDKVQVRKHLVHRVPPAWRRYAAEKRLPIVAAGPPATRR